MELRRSLRLSKRAKTENNLLQSPTTTLKDIVVPLDIQIEILNRLPVKSLVRLLLLSKSIAQVIKSKAFLKSYPFRSLKQPCHLLIAFMSKDNQTKRVSYDFYSASSLYSPSTSASTSISTSFLSRITCPARNQLAITSPAITRLGGCPTSYVNGLFNIGSIICNPCTGKVTHLPRIKTARPTRLTKRFFGYEPVDKQYKVLCISLKEEGMWLDFQVSTLGAKPKSWRTIQCGIQDHGDTVSPGLCIDGVVYYLVHTGRGMNLVGFDLKTETFDIFARLSQDILERLHRCKRVLINYHGRVAIAIHVQPDHDEGEARIDLYIFEAGIHNLLVTSFDNLPHRNLCMKGINHRIFGKIDTF
ncbi:unnamed protein product [Cochlearia groenlandica]